MTLRIVHSDQESGYAPHLLMLDVEALRSNPLNLRADLAVGPDLIESIRSHGVLQPLLVTEADPDEYLIVAGHRRFAAAVRAGLAEVPAIVRDDLGGVSEQVATMIGENADRVDLNIVEKAKGYQLMLDDGMSITAISKRTGHKAAEIKKHLPAAAADERVQGLLADGKIGLDDLAALDEFDDDPETRASLERILGTSGWRYELQRHQNNRRWAEQSVSQREELEAKGITVSSNTMRLDDAGEGMTWEKLPAGTDPAEVDGEVEAIIRRDYHDVKNPSSVEYHVKVPASEKALAKAAENKAARLLEEELEAASAVRAQWLAARAARATSVTQAATLVRQLIMGKLDNEPFKWRRFADLLGIAIEIPEDLDAAQRGEHIDTKIKAALSKMLLPQLVTHLAVLENEEVDLSLRASSAWGKAAPHSYLGARILAWREQLAAWRYPLAPVEQRLVDAAASSAE